MKCKKHYGAVPKLIIDFHPNTLLFRVSPSPIFFVFFFFISGDLLQCRYDIALHHQCPQSLHDCYL